MKLGLLVLVVASLLSIACASQNSEEQPPLEINAPIPTNNAPKATNSASTPTRIAPTPTRKAPTPTRIVLAPGVMPDFAFLSTQIGDGGNELDVYISLTNSEDEPVKSTGDATLRLRFADGDENEVFTDVFNLTGADLSNWSNRFSG